MSIREGNTVFLETDLKPTEASFLIMVVVMIWAVPPPYITHQFTRIESNFQDDHDNNDIEEVYSDDV